MTILSEREKKWIKEFIKTMDAAEQQAKKKNSRGLNMSNLIKTVVEKVDR